MRRVDNRPTGLRWLRGEMVNHRAVRCPWIEVYSASAKATISRDVLRRGGGIAIDGALGQTGSKMFREIAGRGSENALYTAASSSLFRTDGADATLIRARWG